MARPVERGECSVESAGRAGALPGSQPPPSPAPTGLCRSRLPQRFRSLGSWGAWAETDGSRRSCVRPRPTGGPRGRLGAGTAPNGSTRPQPPPVRSRTGQTVRRCPTQLQPRQPRAVAVGARSRSPRDSLFPGARGGTKPGDPNRSRRVTPPPPNSSGAGPGRRHLTARTAVCAVRRVVFAAA